MAVSNKVYITGLAWVAVLTGVVAGVIYPIYRQIENFPTQYQQLSLRLRELEYNIAKYSETKAEFEAIEATIPKLKACLLDEKNAVVFIESLEELSRSAGVFSDIQPIAENAPSAKSKDKAKVKDASPNFKFNLMVVGTFENAMKFLVNLENFKYAIDVDKISLTMTKEGQTFRSQNSENKEGYRPEPGSIAMNLQIKAYSNSQN